MIPPKRLARLKKVAQDFIALDDKLNGWDHISDVLSAWDRADPARGMLDLIAELEALRAGRPLPVPRGAGCCTKLRALEAAHAEVQARLDATLEQLRQLVPTE